LAVCWRVSEGRRGWGKGEGERERGEGREETYARSMLPKV
jgi:hypothetical protein